MASFVIEGGNKLEGEIEISGSKNSSLPILAGCILNKGITKLYNVPNIEDTKIMLEILKVLGCKIRKNRGKIVIDSRKINKNHIPEELMCKMRSSVILAGALISRNGKAQFSYPGGCDIGARPIDMHLEGFKKIGIIINEKNGYINCDTQGTIGNEITLDFPSVGATENLILASVFSQGKTIIKNVAREPEITDLQNFLNKMGAKITGAGESEIVIQGIKEIKNANICYTIMSDRIEAGTFLCAAAVTKGNIKINNINPKHLSAVLSKLIEAGCEIETGRNSIKIQGPKKIKSVDIITMPYPGFPTDMQSIFSAILLKASGSSMIVENIFENRYKYTAELIKMGAKIKIEGRTAVIKGVRKISGTKVKCTDLRGGAALIVAGLMANGKTEITDINYVLRGYDHIEKKLQSLGAKISIKEGD